MTAGCILLLYLVRKLGLVEMENDQLRASQQALLRQVGFASTGRAKRDPGPDYCLQPHDAVCSDAAGKPDAEPL